MGTRHNVAGAGARTGREWTRRGRCRATCSTCYGTTQKQTGKKKEQATDSTARRDAIIWVIQAVRTAAVVGTLPIYLGTKMSLYVNVNMSLDQSFSTEHAYQNKHVSIYISFYLLIDFILFIKVAFHVKSNRINRSLFICQNY